MASLKALKTKIAGVKSTRKITQAMKMVAASKMRRNQTAFNAAKPYATRMETMVSNVLGAADEISAADFPLLGSEDRDSSYLIIAVGSEKGLAGAFNINLIKHMRSEIQALEAEGKSVKILAVGTKLGTVMRSHFADKMLDGFAVNEKNNGQLTLATELGKKIVKLIEDEEFDRCLVMSNRFLNALIQKPTTFSVVPPEMKEAEEGAAHVQYDYEATAEELLEKLLPRNLEVQIFMAILESALGEQAARTTAMDGATRNAGKMIDSLTLKYNRSRQANITQELSEIVAGAAAVGS